MLSKQVDATLGAFWNYEGVDLQRRGRNPEILRMEDLGVPTYDELVFVARREDLDEDGASKLRRFLQADGARPRGARATTRRPGVDALLKADPDLDRGLQQAAVKATLPVFFPAERAAVRLAGPGRVGGLRRLDARQRAAQAAAERGAGADQRVPAGRGARPGRAIAQADGQQAARGRRAQVLAGEPLPLAVGLEEPAHLGLVGARLRVARGRRPTSLR